MVSELAALGKYNNEIDKKACFDEVLSAGLLKHHSKEDYDTIVYSLVK